MPAVTITAVDTGTETLTAIAHGLTTGDRTRVRNVDGALPTGLSSATDYFAIRVDADNVKLATSNANAIAGTAINLTGAGSGTNTLEYGLPYCIPTIVAAPLGQIRSADDNGTWAALAALYAYFTGGSQSIWTEKGRTKTVCRSAYGETASGGTVGPSGQIWRLSVSGVLEVRLPEVPVGKRIVAVRYRLKDGTSAAVTCRFQSDVDGARTTITSQVSAGSNALQTLSLGPLSTVVAAGTTYFLQATGTTTTSDHYRVEVDYDS